MSRKHVENTHLLEGIRQLLSQLSGEVALLQEGYDQVLTTIERLERRSDCDDLTGLLRRNAFFQRWNTLMKECQKIEENCSLLFVDVDHFKSINDRYGHAVGDQVLKELATLLKQFESPSVFVGRYGGEEFVIAIQGDECKSLSTAEWIRRRAETLSSSVKFTVSVGVAHAAQTNYQTDAMMEAADRALYQAKKEGRNQVKKAAA